TQSTPRCTKKSWQRLAQLFFVPLCALCGFVAGLFFRTYAHVTGVTDGCAVAAHNVRDGKVSLTLNQCRVYFPPRWSD
ncbi:MAG: hypothetical protein KDE24_10435, partial [Caldilinea sp.]|nr:hypothetical protein [Caldilinea sp.]